MDKEYRKIFTGEGWPEVISRREVQRLTGGLVHQRTIANLDSLGKGPGGKVRLGRNVGYKKQDLLDWLNSRAVEA